MGDAAQELSERIDRLVSALEIQTNVQTRMLQLMQDEQKRKRESKKAKARRAVLPEEKKIEATPMVQAQVKRALARYGR